ncbi:MAG: tyrosine-protein phosphatase [Oscillospiraceae bacterium]|nr:tyrosine-protein phosphatase [Oscillospiraceae bacterium]
MIRVHVGNEPLRTAVRTAVVVAGSTSPELVVTDYSIDNQAIQDFDENVTYTADYSTTEMGTYDHPAGYTHSGMPNGVAPSNIVGGTMELVDVNMGTKFSYSVSENDTIYNVSPNGVSHYRIIKNGEVVSAGTLRPTGKVRTIYGTTLKNCRDLGGWDCDGGTVKYGKLFRGSELTGNSRPTEQITAFEKRMMTDLLGIQCEIDLRDVTEAGGTATFDHTVDYLHQGIGDYASTLSDSVNLSRTKTVMSKIMNNAIKGIPTFYHCVAGADGAGTVSWLLLGILGVSQSDCDKEYELTCLAGPTRFRNQYLIGLYNKVMSYGKATFQANIAEAFRQMDIDIDLVNGFRKAMIDGTPSDLSYDVPAMTITSNGTYDVSAVNEAVVNVPVVAPEALTGEIMGDGTMTITIPTNKQCSFVSVFLDAPMLSQMDVIGSLCVHENCQAAGVLNRWRGTYGAGYDFTSPYGGTVTFNSASIVITTSAYPFAAAKYRWIAC